MKNHQRSHVRSVVYVVAALALCGGGCRKDARHTPIVATGSGSADLALAPGDAGVAVAADAGAGADLVDLFRAVPSTIRVSSRVRNKAILPAHIADRDLGTAWNSLTGELIGAWVEISVDGAQIDAVKLTVGHTGHGPKGEDYFTMNPRIRQVKLDDDGKPLGTYDLDITKRELQAIHVKPKGTLRLTVTQIALGWKKTWRETAISELEAWGMPDAGWQPPKKPLVPNVEVQGEVQAAGDPCADIQDRREKFAAAHANDDYGNGPGAEDHAYPPDCSGLDLPANVTTLSAPWSGALGSCDINDEIYGPKDCSLSFTSGSATAMIAVENFMAHGDVTVLSMDESDVIPGGRNELVVRIKNNDDELVAVCRVAPTLACSEPVDSEGAPNDQVLAKHPPVFK